MQQYSLLYNTSNICYYVFGNGPKILYGLHGYGESGASFAFLEKYLGSVYTIYAIDFPFHGKTAWRTDEVFMPEDLMHVLDLLHSNNKNKFSLLAYSMGGRAAMHLLQQYPEKIERVALVAPDGLHQNIWYWLTTQTTVGNKAFSFTMHKPAWFFNMVHAGERTRLLNKSIVKFIHYYLDDATERTLLYKRWTFMRKFRPKLKTVKEVCMKHNIQLRFLFGGYDRIILSKRAAVFKHTKNISIQVIHAGHQLLKEKYAAEIVALLNG